MKRKHGIIEKNIFYILTELCLCFIWMELSYIEWQGITVVTLFLISAFSACNIEIKFMKLEFQGTKIKYAVIGIASIFMSFSLVGNRGIVYPISSAFSLGRLLTFIISFIWAISVIITIIYIIQRISILAENEELSLSRRDRLFFFISLGMILVIPDLFSLIAFNPGITSYDTWDCMVNYARHIIGMPNWHPPFYILFLKIILTIWDSTYAVVIVQIIMWTAVWLYTFAFLYNKGLRVKVIYIIAVLVGIGTSNCLYVVSIWKDIPYAICLLLLSVLTAKLLMEEDKNLTNKFYFLLIITLVSVCLFRQNGIVPFVVTIIALGIAFRKNKKLICSLTISILLAIFIRYPLYSFLEVDNTQMNGKYIGLGQDIVGTYLAGGNVSDSTKDMISVLVGGDMENVEYSPYYAALTYDLDVSMYDFVACYLDTFIHNPGKMIRCIMCRNDVIWDIFPGEDSYENLVNYMWHADNIGDWLEYYPEFKETFLFKYAASISTESADNQVLNAILWRTGIWAILLIIISIIAIARKQKKLLLVSIPFWAQILSLALSTGWADYRYYWPLNLISLFFIVFFFLYMRKYSEQNQ